MLAENKRKIIINTDLKTIDWNKKINQIVKEHIMEINRQELFRIDTKRIREVMVGLRDLAVILGYEDGNPMIDMAHGNIRVPPELLKKTPRAVCIGCWMDILFNGDDYRDDDNVRGGQDYVHGFRSFMQYIGFSIGKDPSPAYYLNKSTVFKELWGNKDYASAFFCSAGYGPQFLMRFLYLDDVIVHWLEFADRIDEEKERYPENNIGKVIWDGIKVRTTPPPPIPPKGESITWSAVDELEPLPSLWDKVKGWVNKWIFWEGK